MEKNTLYTGQRGQRVELKKRRSWIRISPMHGEIRSCLNSFDKRILMKISNRPEEYKPRLKLFNLLSVYFPNRASPSARLTKIAHGNPAQQSDSEH
jgi:hypothetical protein